jgi:hypothetical protein
MKKEMNSATFLSDAAKSYETITAVLKEVGNQFEAEIGKKDFSSERFLAQFDLLLQLVLFKTGIADGKLSENEALAIQELPQYGDLLTLLSDGKKGQKVHWEDFVNEGVSTLVNFTRMAEEAADGIIRNFFSPIAFVDEETNGEERFFLLVAHAIHQIADDVSGIDGLQEESEKVAAYQAMMSDCRDRYDAEVKAIRAQLPADGQA